MKLFENKRKKILFLVRSLDVGGVNVSLIDFLNLLNDDNFIIVVGVQTKENNILENRVPKWARVVYYLESNSHLFNSIIIKRRDYKYWKKTNFYKAVFFKFFNQFEKIRNIYRIKKLGYFDYAVAFHQGFASHILAHYVKAKIKYFWLHSSNIPDDCKEKDFDKANKIVLCVPQQLKMLCDSWNLNKKNISVIPPILNDANLFSLASIKREFQCDVKYLCSVCRLSKEKGLANIIETSLSLIKSGIVFRWYVVGDGPLRRQFENDIKNNGLANTVILLGESLNPYPFINGCFVFVSTSSLETFGVSIAEAKLLKKVIVGTDTFAMNYHVANGVNGFIVSDPKELSSKLYQLFTDAYLWEKMRIACDNYDYTKDKEMIRNCFLDLFL